MCLAPHVNGALIGLAAFLVILGIAASLFQIEDNTAWAWVARIMRKRIYIKNPFTRLFKRKVHSMEMHGFSQIEVGPEAGYWQVNSNTQFNRFKGLFTMILPVDKIAPFRLVFKDKCGNITTTDGKPIVTVVEPNMARVEMNADGMSGRLIPLCPLGVVHLKAVADTDPGSGKAPIEVEAAVSLVAGQAVLVELTFDNPVNP
jgi:hypothetical protein